MAVSQRPLSAAALTEKATVAGWNNLPAGWTDDDITCDWTGYLGRRG
jgi:hypothetical protein